MHRRRILLTGSFDGKGYTISGIDFSEYTARTACIGLFVVTDNAKIRNLTVEGTVSSAGQDVGGIVGSNILSDIRGCLNVGTIVSKNDATAVGGVLGGNEKTGSAVAYCLDRGVVVNGGDAHRYIGQFVGYPSVRPT